MRWNKLSSQRQEQLLQKLSCQGWVRVAGVPTDEEQSTWNAFIVSLDDTSIFFQGASNVLSTDTASPHYRDEVFTINMFEIEFTEWKKQRTSNAIATSVVDLTEEIDRQFPQFLAANKSVHGFSLPNADLVEIKANNFLLTGISGLGFSCAHYRDRSVVMALLASQHNPMDVCYSIAPKQSADLLAGLHFSVTLA